MSDPISPQQAPGKPVREPIFLLPGWVLGLLGLMVAIHLGSVLTLDVAGMLARNAWLGFVPFRMVAPDRVDGGILPLLWSPFTHAFLHAGWDHLIINGLWFLIFASPVSRRYGGPRMTLIFLISAACGALLFAATTYGQVQILIGASGGVAGLTGAASRFIFQPVVVQRDPETGEQRVLGRHLASLREAFVEPRSRSFIIIWTVLNAAVPLLPAFTGSQVEVAWQAHLGGFFAGLLMVGLFERRPPQEP